MNKFKTMSSISLSIAGLSLILPSNLTHKASALSNTIYALTSEDYEVQYKDKTIILTFKNNTLHNNISSIKLKTKDNKYLNFEKTSSNFKLTLDENLTDGIYSLVFYDKSSSSSTKELVSPLYIDFPELSNQELSVTSLNPIISLTNLNGVNKLNARFTVLNIKDKITNGRILNSQDSQIGYLENVTTPRNFIFNLGSSTLSTNEIYYIEYTLENSEGKATKIKVPFTYSTNSVQLDQMNTNNFVYTSTSNNDGSINLTLNFKGVDNKSINFSEVDNYGVRIIPSYDNNGNILLKNLSKNSSIQVDIKDSNGKTQTLVFKVPESTQSNETPIPFMKFINASSIVLKKGSEVTVPIIKDDLVNAGFTTPNTYLEFVYYDDFGNEISITDEKRISSSTSKASILVNSNVESLTEDNQVYIKVYTPTKYYLFPFNASNITSSSKSCAFDVIKSNVDTNSVSLTFRPNSNLLSSTETFSEDDLLIINDSIEATLSSDKRSFSITTKVDSLPKGANTYTLIRNNPNGNSTSITGEFLVDLTTSDVSITNIVESFNPKVNNSQELILGFNINDEFINSGTKNSVKITDEFGTSITLKSSVKQTGSDKYLEVIIDPPTQLISGKYYTVEFSNGINSFTSNFIYNNNTTYNPDIDLVFNGTSTFTLKNLSSLPGYTNYEFNIKIMDYYNKSTILYENFSQSYYGEKLNSDSITRDLKDGKYFVDGDRYLVEIRNVTTGDTYKDDFTFRENNIVGSGDNESSSNITISSGSLNHNNNSINFNYSKPSNKTVATVLSNLNGVTSYYSNGKIYLEGLVPNKLYRNLSLTVNFSDGTNQIIKLNEFTSSYSDNNLKNYIAKVYTTALTPVNETNKYNVRYADEEGFNYWYNMLYNGKFTGPEFIYRILDANEFNKVHASPQDKIQALYPIVVNRYGDTDGMNFWINEFNTLYSSLNSQDLALKVTLSKMLNESEPQQLFKSLGIRLN